MTQLKSIFEQSTSANEYVSQYRDHMATLLSSLDTEAVSEALALIAGAAQNDKTVFLVGNGGSGAVGGHWVNDLGPNTVTEGQPGFRVISLTDNPFSVTAVGNDVSFEEIFSLQLRAAMREGDIVIAMSVSGNSPNIVSAVRYANEHGGVTIGCTGFDGGALKDLCRVSIHTPSTTDEYGPVEDVFSVVMHIVTSYITMSRGRMLQH